MLDDEWIRVISNCWCIIYSHHIEKSTKSNLSVKFVTIKTVCVLPSHKLHIVFSFLLLLVPASSAIRFSYRNDQNWRLNTQKLIKNPLDLKKLRFQIPRYSNLSPTHLIASDRIATFAFQHSSSLVFNILEALKKKLWIQIDYRIPYDYMEIVDSLFEHLMNAIVIWTKRQESKN